MSSNENNLNVINPNDSPVDNLSNDSLEIIEVGSNEKINIKKVVKYKEINGIYIKGEVLGQGVFGKVRECVHNKTLKRYAVKIIKIERFKRQPNVKRNIEKEMKIISKLNHKNVMKMIDTFSTKNKIYIFMEYCVGVLSEILDCAPNGRLPKWQTHHYFCQLINGLKYIHSKSIYHRDIKEDNLLIDNSNVIKIADFGCCHILDLFAEEDIISGYEGTILYQPPEILDDGYSGSKFDIWSAGVVLFRMISGGYPFFNKGEDVLDKNSYNNLKYPQIISEDKPLLNLMKNILNIDFNTRITIRGIKCHPWIQLKHKKDLQKVDLPQRKYGDIYRGMTLLERLRVKYEYPNVSQTKPEFVDQKEYEESLKPKDPNVKPDRILSKRQPKEKLKPLRRLNRMGLLT